MQKKYIFVFILAFLFFLQTLPVWAQGAQCDSCGTSITYSNFGAKTKTGGYLCKSCYRQQKEQPQQQQTETEQKQEQPQQQTQQQANGIQCGSCGTSITNYSNLGSRTKTGYLCKNCYRKQQEEQQQRIQSKKQWLQQQQAKQKEEERKQQEQQKQQAKQQEQDRKKQEKQIHSQKKVCTLCNKPFVAGETYYLDNDDKPLCSTCYNKTFKCTLCNKPFAGKKYYLIHDKSFCSTCYNTFKERCNTCGYLIPQGEEVRNGSWVVCTSCSKDIVTTDSQLKACYAEAFKFMKAYLGLNVPVPVDNVYFSDMTEMTEMAKKSGTDYATEAVGLFSDGKNILCQKGMSKQDSVKTLVHESAHACMHQFGTDKKASPMYEEGFADWCAYKYIMSIGKTWYSKKDRIYTEGLRKMLELEKKMKSEDGLLEYVKTHNDFPKE